MYSRFFFYSRNSYNYLYSTTVYLFNFKKNILIQENIFIQKIIFTQENYIQSRKLYPFKKIISIQENFIHSRKLYPFKKIMSIQEKPIESIVSQKLQTRSKSVDV